MVSPLVPPLEKVTAGGQRYRRPADIESAIADALELSPSSCVARASIADPAAPERLASEVVVHLIRRAYRQGDVETHGALLGALLRRCSAALDHSVRGDRFPDAEEIRSEILSRFAEGFAVDAAGDPQHRLDFFEIRFNAAFARLRLDVTRSEARRRRHLVPLPEGASAQNNDDPQSLPPKVFSRPANQEEQLRRVELRRAIDALPPDERDVIILSRILGYPIESDDPSKMTVAKHCGVSPRTVRNRLTRALTKLARTLDTGDSP